MVRIIAPVVDDIEDLRAHDSTEHDQDAQIPRLFAIDPQALGIAHTDPQAEQDAGRDQESIRRQEKPPKMYKLRMHRLS